MASYSDYYNEQRAERERRVREVCDPIVAHYRGIGYLVETDTYADRWGRIQGKAAGDPTCMYCGCLVDLAFTDIHRNRCKPIAG